jgi:hypothetical protein
VYSQIFPALEEFDRDSSFLDTVVGFIGSRLLPFFLSPIGHDPHGPIPTASQPAPPNYLEAIHSATTFSPVGAAHHWTEEVFPRI